MPKKARSPRPPAPEKTTTIAALPASKSQLEAKRAALARSQPTVAELSHLAAAFVAGHKARSPEAVRQALNLWKACKDALKADVEQGVKAAIVEEEARAETAKIPVPDKFPVPLDKFLRLIVRGKHPEDRHHKFRLYLTDSFDPDQWKEERLDPLGLNAKDLVVPDADDWANSRLGELKQSKISQAQYRELAPGFAEWLGQHAAKQATVKAQRAALTRWGKKQAGQKGP